MLSFGLNVLGQCEDTAGLSHSGTGGAQGEELSLCLLAVIGNSECRAGHWHCVVIPHSCLCLERDVSSPASSAH